MERGVGPGSSAIAAICVRSDTERCGNGDAGLWDRLSPALNPTPRSGIALTHDVTGGLVAIGGDSVSGTFREVFRLSSELSTQTPERCLLASEDTDGDMLSGCADPDCWTRCNPTCAAGASCAGPHCGDGTCSSVEDYAICPADCIAP